MLYFFNLNCCLSFLYQEIIIAQYLRAQKPHLKSLKPLRVIFCYCHCARWKASKLIAFLAFFATIANVEGFDICVVASWKCKHFKIISCQLFWVHVFTVSHITESFNYQLKLMIESMRKTGFSKLYSYIPRLPKSCQIQILRSWGYSLSLDQVLTV